MIHICIIQGKSLEKHSFICEEQVEGLVREEEADWEEKVPRAHTDRGGETE